MTFSLNRRAVLRGIGAGLSLPILECMLDSRGLLLRDGHAAGTALPVRYLAFMIQNGPPKRIWSPKDNADGSFTLNSGLQPLAHLQADLNQITGLHANTLANDFAHTDGQKGFWTGYPKHFKPAGKDVTDSFGSSVSIENLLGQKLGAGNTVFPQLTASLPRGYADRYENGSGKNSYVADRQPQSYIADPASLAAKLLGQAKTSSGTTTTVSDPRQVTILDFLQGDAKRLQARLSSADKARLDQHLTAVREIEQQLNVVNQATCSPFTTNVPKDLGSNRRVADETAMPLMAKLIVFAFQCDLTRYALFEVANVPPKVDNPPMVTSDSPDMWDHYVSHNKNNTVGDDDPDHVYIAQKKMAYWALFLDAMKASPEGGKTILYNSVSLLGTDVSVGAYHNFDDMPLITVGQAGGKLKTGQHLSFPSSTTYNNLHATLLTAVGLPTTKFGADGTGTLSGLLV